MGSFDGPAVPFVSGFQPQPSRTPASWPHCAATGGNLIEVRPPELRKVADQHGDLTQRMLTGRNLWEGEAWRTASPTLKRWPEAEQLSVAVEQSHEATAQSIEEFTQALADNVKRIILTVDRYEAVEHDLVAKIHKIADSPISPGIGYSGYNAARVSIGIAAGRIANQSLEFPATDASPFESFSAPPYHYEDVHRLISPIDPDAIGVAAAAYARLSVLLTDVPDYLVKSGSHLAKNWSSAVAPIAVAHIQLLHQSAVGLQATTWAIHQILQWYSDVLRVFKSELPRPASPYSAADQAAADEAAQQRMAALNEHIRTVHAHLPRTVRITLPPPLYKRDPSASGYWPPEPPPTDGGVSGYRPPPAPPNASGTSGHRPPEPSPTNSGTSGRPPWRLGNDGGSHPCGRSSPPSPTQLSAVQPGGPGTVMATPSIPATPGGGTEGNSTFISPAGGLLLSPLATASVIGNYRPARIRAVQDSGDDTNIGSLDITTPGQAAIPEPEGTAHETINNPVISRTGIIAGTAEEVKRFVPSGGAVTSVPEFEKQDFWDIGGPVVPPVIG